ncbi:Oligoxyloglucan reducing end-specific cellobiohydrolase [Atractiella rhizophila]|nr:Oligoxyloglucan reducing end-specific cellobiohydrolase [Atractiella rhizophila]
MHQYNKDRAYLVAGGRKVYTTTNKGQRWTYFQAPLDANILRIPLLDFHPTRPDWLIWTGSKDCSGPLSNNCHAQSYYTRNNGDSWSGIDSYVRICSWGRDKKLWIDEKTIFCESYKNKEGSQHSDNTMQFVEGKNFYTQKKVLFDNIVGYATFEEYMVVAEVTGTGGSLTLQVSLNGDRYASALFPPNMRIMPSAFTVLESTTDSVFLHVTTSGAPGAEWGSLFKSNSNGTYYTMSLEHVNRNDAGYVDFEKMIGLDGIALINVVSNPDDATLTGKKELQTRGRWKPIIPPARDSLGRSYDCMSTSCSLHIHGYTERRDPRATYSSPTAVGLMIGVGNVGEKLAPYEDSDTFLTRDGGFTWDEVHKDAHLWEYGDQGSIIVLVNDEQPTDFVTYTLNEGLSWQDYNFGQKLRVRTIVTVPQDTSRKFILFGSEPGRTSETVAVHLDFSQVTNTKCNLDLADPNNDDFELWSPSEKREQTCLFGRQVMYHRRIRERNCYVGEIMPQPFKKERDCLCTDDDFECEFNYRRDPYTHQCVLVDGAQPLPNNDTCTWQQDFWYERTAYRKVPHSSCIGEDAVRLDLGKKHACPAQISRSHGFFYWAFITIIPVLAGSLLVFWWMRRRGGRIYLGEPSGYGRKEGGAMDVIASVPYFLLGLVAVTASWLNELRYKTPWSTSRGIPYRQLPIDDDAEVLGDYLDDE